MGVVRREGDWRLEKQKEGVYVITYQKQKEAKMITSDYSPEGFEDERNDFSVTIHEVESFSEVKEVFNQMAEREPSVGGFGTSFEGLGGGTNTKDDQELPDLPPGGTIIVGGAGGSYLISRTGFDVQSPLFLLGCGLIAIGLVVVLLTARVFTSDGPAAAIDYLISGQDDDSKVNQGGSSGEEDTTTTPPAPEEIKNELYFERADRKCEWCGESVDAPDVHHITPRNEGGPNEPENLIVLCPNCHRKADRGVISRSKLRYQISS